MKHYNKNTLAVEDTSKKCSSALCNHVEYMNAQRCRSQVRTAPTVTPAGQCCQPRHIRQNFSNNCFAPTMMIWTEPLSDLDPKS